MSSSSAAAVIQQPPKPDATENQETSTESISVNRKQQQQQHQQFFKLQTSLLLPPALHLQLQNQQLFSIFFSSHSLSRLRLQHLPSLSVSLSLPRELFFLGATVKTSKQTSEIWIFLWFFFPPLFRFVTRASKIVRERERSLKPDLKTHTLRITIIAANRQKDSTLAQKGNPHFDAKNQL